MEWVNTEVFPIIESFDIPIQDKLNTYIQHIAKVIAEDLNATNKETILITGGGAYHIYLIECVKKQTNAKIIIPDNKTVDYKEALIFGLLGVLKTKNDINVLASVTGAKRDHSSGNIFEYIP